MRFLFIGSFLIVCLGQFIQSQSINPQSNACQPRTQLQQFIQNSHTFVFSQLTQPNLNINQNLLSLTVSQKFIFPFDRRVFGDSSIPQLAYSVHEYDSSETFQFNFLLLSKVTNLGVQFDFVSVGMKWSKIKVQFWLSTRIDITLGTFHIENALFNGDKLVQSVKLPTNLPQAIDPNTIFINFLNGLKFNQNSQIYEVSISKKSATENQYSVQIDKSGKSIIEQVIFSYLIFNPNLSLYASNGGLRSFPSFGIAPQYIKAHSNFVPIKLYLIGLNAIKLSKQNNQFRISFSLDADNIINAQSFGRVPINQITLIYLTIGISPEKVCENCPSKPFIDANNSNTCVAACPQRTYPFSYFKGGLSCLSCSSKINQVLTPQKTGCQCQIGFQRSSNQNICQKRAILSLQQQSSILCVQPNTVFSNGGCLCVPGSHNISGKCIFCKENEVFDGIKCKFPNCPGVNQFRNSNGNCMCAIGFIKNTQNICVPLCSLFSMPDLSDPLNQSKCKCITGFYNVSGSCQTCPSGTIYNQITQKCECRPNQRLNQITKKCECQQGFNRNTEGVCIKCGIGQFFNGQNCQFINCKANQKIQINNKIGSAICVCIDEFIKINSVCTKLQPLRASIQAGFPILITPGIIIDFNVRPIFQNLSPRQLSEMFKVQIQPQYAFPKEVSITQFKQIKDRFRVFLNYHTQTPLQIISIKIKIEKQPFGQIQIQRIYDVLGSGMSSAIGVQKDILK